MRIEIKDGVPIVYPDTVEEGAAFIKAFGGTQLPQMRPVNIEAQIADESERVKRFFTSINANGRKFLVSLISYKNGIKGEKLAELTGFSADKFGGIMGGMAKQAENQTLRRDAFIVSEMRTAGTERYRFLAPGPLLLKYEIELARIMKKEGQPETASMGA